MAQDTQSAKGGDPVQAGRDARAGLAFQAVTERYLAAMLDEVRNRGHKAQWQPTPGTCARPVPRSKLAAAITLKHVPRDMAGLALAHRVGDGAAASPGLRGQA